MHVCTHESMKGKPWCTVDRFLCSPVRGPELDEATWHEATWLAAAGRGRQRISSRTCREAAATEMRPYLFIKKAMCLIVEFYLHFRLSFFLKKARKRRISKGKKKEN